jgi:hypothetical protein
MRTLLIAANDTCSSPSLKECMAWACGMRARATDAVLYYVAVGVEKKWSDRCSSVFELCSRRFLFRETVSGLCFFCGPACWLVFLRLYIISCWRCTLWVMMVLYFPQSWESAESIIPVSFPFNGFPVFRVADVYESWASVR